MAKKRTKASNARNTRKRKASTSDEEERRSPSPDVAMTKKGSVRRYNIEELVTSEEFNHPELLLTLPASEFTKEYIAQNGLSHPIIFSCKPEELGMKMPNPRVFDVEDVMDLVGKKREVEVVEVDEQGSASMSLQEIVEFYKSPQKTTLYNVLSLEFSTAPLRDVVSGPAIVKELDWVENHYPDELKRRVVKVNKKGFYTFDHEFPQVQHYCLMSVAKCYTDFHVDFGGTSVWYHVLKGEKIFWLIEPTDHNLMIYDQFTKNYNTSTFLGKIVEKCHRVTIKEGQTAIIPSGWIHGVYTPVDSLVFGGNFVIDETAGMCAEVNQLETKLTIRQKYRFPYFEELVFYVFADMVKDCTGRIYLRPVIVDDNFEYVGKRFIEEKKYLTPINPDDYVTPVVKTDPPKEVMIDYGGDDIFYDPPVISDRKKCKTPTHRIPFDEDLVEHFVQDEMDKIGAKKLEAFEYLWGYIRNKKLVDVPDFITRPSSLLIAVACILRQRRVQLVENGVELKEEPELYARELKNALKRISSPMKTRRSTASSTPRPESPAQSESGRSEELGLENEDDDENIPLSVLIQKTPQKAEAPKEEENASEEAATVSGIKEEEDVEMKEEAASEGHEEVTEQSEANDIKKEEEDDQENSVNEEKAKEVEEEATETESTHETPTKTRNGTEKQKKPKPPTVKKTPKPKEKKKRSCSFQEALGAPEKKKKKNDKKDKPQFVGGLPMAPIQDEPVVANPYNYDPMAEIMQLGTGQLQSAYRKSKQTIAPPSEKKFFKLEHSHSTESEEPPPSVIPATQTTPPAPSPAPLAFSQRRSTFSGAVPQKTETAKPLTIVSPISSSRRSSGGENIYSPTAPRQDLERRLSIGTPMRINIFPDISSPPASFSPPFASPVAKVPFVLKSPIEKSIHVSSGSIDLTPLEMAAKINADRALLDELNKV